MIRLVDLLTEKKLTSKEKKEKEKIVKGMKKAKGDLKKRYGKEAEKVMYATATKRAMAEELDPVGKEDEDINNDDKVNSQDKYLLKRRKKIAKDIKKEGHLKWPQTPDHEATMAKGELRSLIKNATTIYNLIQENQQLPGWVSAYVTLASDYMNSVAQYLTEEEATNE